MDKCNTCYKWSKDGCYDKTRSCQYVEKKPVTKGKWIYEENDWFTDYRCSVCKEVFCGNNIGISIESIYHFCPNCGADLREKKDGVRQGR